MSLLSIPVSFKEVYTSNVHNFDIDPNWTITQFIQTVGPVMCREFNIDEDNLEIIEAGYTPGTRSEAAPALREEDTIKIKDKWGTKLNVSFYIRRKDYLHPELNLIAHNPTTESFTGDCPVCLETLTLTSRHTCSHRICNSCHRQCLSNNYTICPICRQV